MFDEDKVPGKILSKKFIHAVKQVLTERSSVVMNVVFEDAEQQQDFEKVLAGEFAIFDRLEKEQNSIYLLPAKINKGLVAFTTSPLA
ncbi:MAG: hypothetical protein EOP54_02220 [Sphingobacteriales bacterium]|nr:MAG: hypothetical protein EOP54_02220 [Sphingobacteriales bacterium]